MRAALDVGGLSCHRAAMAMRVLFGVLCVGLVVVAVAAWRGGQPIPAVGAAAIAAWLGAQAGRGIRRR